MPGLPTLSLEPLFLDSAYPIALHSPRDNWREAALAAAAEIPPHQPFVTSEGVILETLAYFSRSPGFARVEIGQSMASMMTRAMRFCPTIATCPSPLSTSTPGSSHTRLCLSRTALQS